MAELETYKEMKDVNLSTGGLISKIMTADEVAAFKRTFESKLEAIKQIIKSFKESCKHHKQWEHASKKALENERKKADKNLVNVWPFIFG